jgi:succinate-semialdehyde dehydrogenase
MGFAQVGTMVQLKNMGLFKTQGLINGEWANALDNRTLAVNNPATGDVLANVPFMGKIDAEKAIAAASVAFLPWSKRTAFDRCQLLRKWFDLILENKDDLAKLITLENGKPLTEANGEVVYGGGFVEYYAEEGKRVYGDIIPSPFPTKRMLVLKQAVGVVGAITPWNFPLAMITRKVAPALAAGCTIVLKPAELTPLTALAAAELAVQAGIPSGVLNVVMGDAVEIGAAMMDSNEVRKITFTGSTHVGKLLMAAAAKTVKKISLELGGNAPLIIFNDADIEIAVQGALYGKYRNAGQTCVCVNRILVQDGIYDKFSEAFTKAVQKLRVGHGLDPGVTQGPLINEASLKKVETHVQDAVSKGAKVLLGGKRHSLGGTFYEPTVLCGCNDEMLIFREEVFGPVAPLMRFQTDEEAIKMANDTEFGLAAYAYTENIEHGWRIAEALDYGMVGLNETLISSEVAPFGGTKQSGLGREGSNYGIDEYLELKYLCLGNIKQPFMC